MPRFLVPARFWKNVEITLPQAESRHLRTVLRLRHGDVITVFDGEGREAQARVQSVEKGAVSILLLSEGRIESPSLELALAVAVPKAGVMDDLLRQAVELGLSRLTPLAAERTVARWTSSEAAVRVSRWRRIALSAAKQCGLNKLPEIEPVCPPAELFNRIASFDAAFIGSLAPNATPFREALPAMRESKPGRVLLIIGPEGDFTTAEHEAACCAGAVPVSFGRLVFRVDTAALYGLSVIRHELA